MRRALRALGCGLVMVLSIGCVPPEPAPRLPHAAPPPPEPAHQVLVVGTIGKLHMLESGYPLSKLGDVLAAFSPDVMLIGARTESLRKGELEDAPIEMTYVSALARRRGIRVEGIDWRETEAPAPAPGQGTARGGARARTFEQANDPELTRELVFADNAERRRAEAPSAGATRRAWVEHLAMEAVVRHGRPKKVLVFVDALDRGHVTGALAALGYTSKDPASAVARAGEVMAEEAPSDVLEAYRKQLERVAAEGKDPARERLLRALLAHRGQCCAASSELDGP